MQHIIIKIPTKCNRCNKIYNFNFLSTVHLFIKIYFVRDSILSGTLQQTNCYLKRQNNRLFGSGRLKAYDFVKFFCDRTKTSLFQMFAFMCAVWHSNRHILAICHRQIVTITKRLKLNREIWLLFFFKFQLGIIIVIIIIILRWFSFTFAY